MSSTTLEVDVPNSAPDPERFETWEPLRLTPFEAMIIADERPGQSMTCSAEFYFDGRIEREPFERALSLALERHRLLRAVVRGDGKQQHWHPTNRRGQLYWNHSNAQHEREELPQLDITQGPGHRCWVNVDPALASANERVANGAPTGIRSIVRFDFHHACCDAIGGMGYIEDLFTIYDALIHGRTPKLRPIDKSRLRQRDRVPIRSPWRTQLYRMFLDFKKSFRLISTRSIPIPSHRESEPWGDRFIVRHLAEEDLVSLRYAASDASATLNDFLLVEFLCLLRDWVWPEPDDSDRRIVTRAKRDHIRVITPMNLRDREDLKLEAANKIGFSFLSRSFMELQSADTENWSDFITEVNAEIEQAKRLRLPAKFLTKLAIARKSFRWFRNIFSDSRCWGTAVLTQLGDPTRRFYNRFPRNKGRILVGNLILTDFVSCGPLRPLTHAILSTNAYGNELTLSMRCNQNAVARETAESFLDDFVRRLKERGRHHKPDRFARQDSQPASFLTQKPKFAANRLPESTSIRSRRMTLE